MKNTNWTEATTNPMKAISGLLSALQSGKNAWIEVQNNGEQDYPIRIKNPELENPFNWTMSYGVPSRPNEYDQYFNETQKTSPSIGLHVTERQKPLSYTKKPGS